ncbi:FAD-dependent oxidoreductase [Actinomycetospora sp. TBRC 11914]|uniref:FAD-dependent oxidoreductase n=1 Tax=Actinomycetospora sp. TBRC 11914 TaxID=2729387 RepID=UPI00145DD1E2|nr:FAD-binding protein [Actinomycetospora sp. TBRC 11914]NMO91463.1 FAD-binding protein [Actinomycetospora sp. TBRC 11914]
MSDVLEIETDVLVAGGGPAGTWAALRAADAGADVVLVDKGWCGASGATAAAGTGVWYVEPDPQAREEAMASREALGGYLADRAWMGRVLDETYAGMNEFAARGRYPFPVDDDGRQIRRGVQGPEYMRRMRMLVRRAGVRILDHSPLLELLTDADGAVVGAAGQRRQAGGDYRIRAGAVVLATGGCAFASGALGTHVDTGDGTLAAAEVGAHLSGMEFSNAYAIAPAHSSVTKTAYYSYASFYRADGTVLEGAGSTRGRSVIARTLLSEPVLARLDHAGPAEREAMRCGQPNFFLAFDRAGIDPFTDRFPITLLAEGTVRGTGGIALASTACDTDVPGLYAAGDVATREYICGGFTGGGSHNAAWALSSGSWAGRAAAAHARTVADRRRAAVPAGGAGLRPAGGEGITAREMVREVQDQVLPYDLNYLRHGDRLAPALETLHGLWREARAGLADADPWRAREAAAMTAVARWMYTAALARDESRGMHKREDRPGSDPTWHHRLDVGGLDEPWTRSAALEVAA